MKIFIWAAIAAAFLRGLFVFDQGKSAADSYPIASAICLIGAIMCAVMMTTTKPKD